MTLVPNPSYGASGDAFLISAFDLQELNGLLESGAALILLERENELVGYSLITPIEEFTALYAPGSGDTFMPTTTIPIEKTDYLYQIAVAPKYSRRGFGYRLLELAKVHSQSGLLADILVQPLENSASIQFFEKNGFAECGTLILANYRDFGQLQSKVYLWTPSKNDKL
jgi:ribosomal protein S18 acetylase RimI-like enzyme